MMPLGANHLATKQRPRLELVYSRVEIPDRRAFVFMAFGQESGGLECSEEACHEI
jgi:hypothetical protein